jgi:hypothetical protein
MLIIVLPLDNVYTSANLVFEIPEKIRYLFLSLRCAIKKPSLAAGLNEPFVNKFYYLYQVIPISMKLCYLPFIFNIKNKFKN